MYCINHFDCLRSFEEDCRDCTTECPEKAIYLNKKNGKVWINREKCIECGICEWVCPAYAIYEE